MRKLLLCFSLAVASIFCGHLEAQQETTIAFDSGSHLLYTNASLSTPLSGGVAATLGDGDILQLGYYSQGTVTNPFAGTFVLLAGSGGPNTFPVYGNTITIGDDPNNGAGSGQYALMLNFITNSASGNNLPAASQELVIRFFNNTTVASSTAYNSVNAPTWIFLPPTTPPSNVSLSLNDANLRFEDGSTTDFYTDISIVPEASSLSYVGIACGGLLWSIRRRLVALRA